MTTSSNAIEDIITAYVVLKGEEEYFLSSVLIKFSNILVGDVEIILKK